MPFKNLSTVEVYVVAEQMELETGHSRIIWLHHFFNNLYVCYGNSHGANMFCRMTLPDLVSDNLSFNEVAYNLGKHSLKEQLVFTTINRDHFRTWCENAGYKLPEFWFGNSPEAARRHIESETEHLKRQAREYAIESKKAGVVDIERLNVLQNKFGLKGTELHDNLWPESQESRSTNAKNKALSMTRKGNK